MDLLTGAVRAFEEVRDLVLLAPPCPLDFFTFGATAFGLLAVRAAGFSACFPPLFSRIVTCAAANRAIGTR